MRNNIIKRRLEYSMLAGILFNFISLFIPIINLTLTSETKQYTEGYSVGSLVKFLVPAVLNGDKGELSNPPLALMAFLLFGLICWIASLFTLVLVFQSMRAKKVNIFRTIAVSIFELLTALFFLVFSAQMKTFAIKVAVEPYFGNIRTGFNFLGLLPVIIVIAFSFAGQHSFTAKGQFCELFSTLLTFPLFADIIPGEEGVVGAASGIVSTY